MKLTTILISLFFFCGIGNSFAQETARAAQSTDIEGAKWIREVYRYLDLSKEKNAPLYYPAIPEQGRMNLFTMIFKLLSENKISAYEYLDGREVFTDEYKIDFKEFLDRFGISVTSDVDIPSHEVRGYYLKEVYYFETGTSNYGVKTIAVCPIIYRQGDYEANTVRYPLFWIPYDELRPYALRMPIMTSSLNNTMTGTIDDFFRRNKYDGEIYKITNPRNLAISQYTSTPEEMKAEQQRIEQELKDFKERLWKENSDSTLVQPAIKGRKARRNATRPSSTGSSNTMRDRRY